MEDEIDSRTQAEMALKLADSVRTLVRDHIREALQDYGFTAGMNSYPLQSILLNGVEHNPDFVKAVKNVLISQLNKP